MENKVCKKCKKPLPEEYKYKKCESCINSQVQGVKNGIKATAGAFVSVVVVVATKGKFNPKK